MNARTTRRGLPASAVLFACLFAAQAAILVLSPILPQVAAEFGVSTSTAAQLRSVTGLTAGVAALAIAVRGSRFRLTRLLFWGLGMLALGSLASAAAPGFAVLVAAQIPIGLGIALVLSGGLAASEVWATEGQSAKVLSWALVGQPVAWIVGQPLVGVVAGADWRWAWIVIPVVSAAAALAAVAARDPRIPEGSLECDPGGLWRLPGVRGWAFGELAAFAAWTGTLVYAGAFFIETYDASVGATGLILGIVAAAYLPGNFLGRRWVSRGGTVGLLVGFAAASAVAVAVLGAVRTGIGFSTVALCALAAIAGGRIIAGAALGLQLADGRRLAAMSVRTATLQFGYLAGTAIGALVLPTWGFGGLGLVYGGMFVVAGAVYIPGIAARRTPRTVTLHFRRG